VAGLAGWGGRWHRHRCRKGDPFCLSPSEWHFRASAFDLDPGLCSGRWSGLLSAAARQKPHHSGAFYFVFLGLSARREWVCLGGASMGPPGADRLISNGICEWSITSRCCRPVAASVALPLRGGGAPALAAGRCSARQWAFCARPEELRLALAALASRWWCGSVRGEGWSGPAVSRLWRGCCEQLRKPGNSGLYAARTGRWPGAGRKSQGIAERTPPMLLSVIPRGLTLMLQRLHGDRPA